MHSFFGALTTNIRSSLKTMVVLMVFSVSGSALAAMAPATVPGVSDTLFNVVGFPYEGGCQYYNENNATWNSGDANCLTNTPEQPHFPLIIRINTNRNTASSDARYDYDIAVYTHSTVTNITYNGVSNLPGKYYVPNSSFADTVNLTMQYDYQGERYRFLISKSSNSHTLNGFTVSAISQTGVAVPVMPTWSLGMLALLLTAAFINMQRRHHLKKSRTH